MSSNRKLNPELLAGGLAWESLRVELLTRWGREQAARDAQARLRAWRRLEQEMEQAHVRRHAP